MLESLIFDKSAPGRRGCRLPKCDVPRDPAIDELRKREELPLPEVSENEVVRHYTRLSALNYHIDKGMYPLGSCTMKYNPKMNEVAAAIPGFAHAHPLMPSNHAQGCLKVVHHLGQILSEVTGMDQCNMQPAAGAHGELTALMMIKAHFADKGEDRSVVVLPDSAHGTNPASAAVCGFTVKEIPSSERGLLDVEALKGALDDKVAALMITNPNTLGLFEEKVLEICRLCHENGTVVYCDGANMNAIVGRARPGDMGFDIMHLNLHKTFSTPHGGGGPGSGPICFKDFLAPFQPVPVVSRVGSGYRWDFDRPKSIGSVHGHHGNFGIMLRAYAYLLSNGLEGLRLMSEAAVLNANYLRVKLHEDFLVAYDRPCMHEFVISGSKQKKESGVSTMDMAKRLLDLGFHAPTVYFPLCVEEAMMIEPTESEPIETLDRFVEAMKQIAEEAREDPDLLHRAPMNTPVGRFDETAAARNPDLRWTKKD